jgi:predicted TIM-barrel fold metal-dependent hydrolase
MTSRRSNGGAAGGLTRRTLLAAGAAAPLAGLLSRPARAQSSSPPLIVDIHAHNFCAADLPLAGFSAHFIPGFSDFAREVSQGPDQLFRRLVDEIHKLMDIGAPMPAVELESLKAAGAAWPAPIANSSAADGAADKIAAGLHSVASLLGSSWNPQTILRRAAQIVVLISHPRAAISATLASVYPNVGLFVPMLIDFDAWSQDKSAPLADQIDVHGAIGRKSIVTPLPGGARLHPFVSFDPLRPDALDLVKKAIGLGFIGVKLYPPVGFAPTRNDCLTADAAQGAKVDKALQGLYAYCEAEEVPITAHCAPSNEFGLGYRNLVAPFRWAPVLAQFPKLRLNLGHFGHTEGALTKRGMLACESWIRQAVALVAKYDNVYGDLSGSDLASGASSATTYAKLLDQCLANPTVGKRLMFGSDWWLNRFFEGADDYVGLFQNGLTHLSSYTDDLRNDVMGGNAIRFLGFGGGDPAKRTKNGKRLADQYAAAGATPPSWL